MSDQIEIEEIEETAAVVVEDVEEAFVVIEEAFAMIALEEEAGTLIVDHHAETRGHRLRKQDCLV